MTEKKGRTKRRMLHAVGIGARRVLVYQAQRGAAGEKRIVVQWREWENGARRYKVYPASGPGRTEAVAYADGVHETLGRVAAPAPLSIRSLWAQYVEIQLGRKKLRTQENYRYRWRKWELYVGKEHDPNLTTVALVEKFRVELTKAGTVPNQVKEILRVVKLVYNWGQKMELLTVNKLIAFRFEFGSHERAAEPPEYTPEEFRAIVASFERPVTSRTWRPWALIVIAGTQGPRIRALMHLTWDDVDLEGQRVRWASAFDKTNRDRWQPLVPDAVRALEAAKTWREIDEYEGPHVFYSEHAGQKDRPDFDYLRGVYRYQAAVRQLHLAEARAGIATIAGRGFHGLRKCAAGNALQLFGNPKDALDWIGDTDPRRLKEYAKKRDVQQKRVADGLAGSSGMRESASEKLPKSYRAPNAEEAPEPGEVQGVVSAELRHHVDRATGQI